MSNPLVVYGELIRNGAVIFCDDVEHAVAACWPTYDPAASSTERLAGRLRIADKLAAEMRLDAILEAELDPVRRWRLTDQPVAVQRLLMRSHSMGRISGLPSAYDASQPRLVLPRHIFARLPQKLPDNVVLIDGATPEQLLKAAISLKLTRVESLGQQVRS